MEDGKNSSFQLTRLAAKYNQMSTDGRILSNRQSIEIIRQRIMDLCERIDKNQAPDRLANLQKLWLEYNDLEQRGKKLDAIAVRNMISDEFERAYHDYAAWNQMFAALDLDRKLVESEVKVAKEIKAILTAEDAYAMVAKLLAAIISAVNDAKEIEPKIKGKLLQRIQYDFTNLIGEKMERKQEEEDDEVILDGTSSDIPAPEPALDEIPVEPSVIPNIPEPEGQEI